MRIANELKFEVWSSFVGSHPHGNIFQTPELFDLYHQAEKHEPIFVAVTGANGAIQGVLLAVIQKEHKGVLGRFSSRAIIWGGPLVKDDSPDILDVLLDAYNKKIKGRAIYSQFRNLWEWSTEQKAIFVKNGFDYDAHLDILIDLNTTADGLLMGMHKGRRKNIRRAERLPLEFLEIVQTLDVKRSLDLINITYAKVKLPCPDESFFIAAKEKLSKTGNLKMFAAKHNGEIIACRFVLCYKKKIYDWYAGASEAHLDKYPNDYLPWKIMEWGIDQRYEIFDFGGAGKPGVPYGVRDHKLKFGGTLTEFGRFEMIHSRFLYQIGTFAFKIYKKIK